MESSVEQLVHLLHTTASPVSLLRHYPDIGLPHYYYEAGGRHDPPYSDQEEEAIVEAKKKDPASADEVFPNLYIGNKAAAEDTQFLVSKSITHVLNLASNTKLRFFVVPDHESLQTHGIELKEMMLRDKSDEDITRTFSESGRWIRRCLQTGGRVMVNCWQVILAQFFFQLSVFIFCQGASRSATVVLAYLVMHHDMDLAAAVAMVKARRDIRPNNGFLAQLVALETKLDRGMFGNLRSLRSEAGQQMLAQAEAEGTTQAAEMNQYFGKQSHNTFCGVQTTCIILNMTRGGELYCEKTLWNSNLENIVEEAVVRKQGLTLVQLSSVLNSHKEINATHHHTDEVSVDDFREIIKSAMKSHDTKIVINYHMSVLGQLPGLSGHISPAAAYCGAGDRVLVLDVWWETRPVWVTVPDLWHAMDQVDITSGRKRGFVVVKTKPSTD